MWLSLLLVLVSVSGLFSPFMCLDYVKFGLGLFQGVTSDVVLCVACFGVSFCTVFRDDLS